MLKNVKTQKNAKNAKKTKNKSYIDVTLVIGVKVTLNIS